jgi:hypothetical protein
MHAVMGQWKQGGGILFHYSLVARVGNFHFIVRGCIDVWIGTDDLK